MRTVFFFSLLTLTTTLFSAEEIDVSQPLRIDRFFPRDVWFDRPPIDPALPDSFVAVQVDEEDFTNACLWGPAEAIQTALKDDTSISSPLIASCVVQLPIDVFAQTAVNHFAGPQVKASLGRWGDVPYYRMTILDEDGITQMAIIPLNREEKTNIVLTLVTPPGQEKEAEQLWNTFFAETKALPFPLMVKSKGQEMHVGYTLVNLRDKTLRAMAQKRTRDQQVRYILIPEHEDIICEIDQVITCRMGNEWHHGEPLLKLSGTYALNMFYSMSTISILIEEVDEFSPLPALPQNAVVGETSF